MKLMYEAELWGNEYLMTCWSLLNLFPVLDKHL